jgi:hypothetical protein
VNKIFQFAGALGVLAALALPGCGASGKAIPVAVSNSPDWIYAGGVLYRRPHYALAQGSSRSVGPLVPYVPYQPGGTVIVAPKFYLVFWDYKKYGDAQHLQPLLEAYTKNVGGSAHSNIETQYYEKSHGKQIYITNASNQYGGSWNDDSPIARYPTDAQVAAEALKAVGHFGYDPNGVYVIATPHNHSEADFGTVWCSYHSETFYNKNLVPYSNLPYMTDARTGKKCGANIITPPSDESGKDEGMTIFAGHEYGETITDPDAFTAWWGVNGEIADACAWVDMANDKFGKKSYTMQSMVSDASGSCVQSYP